MSTILEEQYQRFTFDGTWTVFSYDCEEAGYYTIRDSVQGTRSCDFLGIRRELGYLIEVKDFRGYRIQNKHRISDGELAEEVAQKVRDTLAGIISGVRRGDSKRPWSELLIQRLGNPEREVNIILFLEDDAASDLFRWKQRLNTLSNQLKAKLNWLRVRVNVISPQSIPSNKLGVTVANLPGACGHGTDTR